MSPEPRTNEDQRASREQVLVDIDELAVSLGLADPPAGSVPPEAAPPGSVRAESSPVAGAFDDVEPPTVLDVRWALGRSDGREQHRAGHVPGAVYVDLETELAGPPSAADGRHPLPDSDAFAAAARRWGVRRDVPVVVYDAVGGTSAARAWWLLRRAGHPDVRILDGGLAAWERAGLPLEAGEVVVPAVGVAPGDGVFGDSGEVVALPGTAALTADHAAALAASGILLDARAGERYRGEVEPVDPQAGHVPGAVSAPTAENLADDGTFLPDAALRARFAALGVDAGTPVGVYCGSGVTAAHEVAALATIGVDAALYPGSWSQWSNDPDRPVATGA